MKDSKHICDKNVFMFGIVFFMFYIKLHFGASEDYRHLSENLVIVEVDVRLKKATGEILYGWRGFMMDSNKTTEYLFTIFFLFNTFIVEFSCMIFPRF